MSLTTLVSALACVLIVLSARWHGSFSYDSAIGVQKIHAEATPRIGGIGILIGLLTGYALSPPDTRDLLGPLMLAGFPAFAIGLLEDLSGNTGLLSRLLITMGSGALGWAITDVSITALHVPLLDGLLGFTFVSVLFTAFAVGGVANALNIVDGFNGLAVGSTVISLLALALLAHSTGDAALAGTALVLAASGLGFALINWPWGKLFLGDGGAYFLGFGVAWVSVLLQTRHPEVSPWALLLICSYPITEVLFSIWRRVKRQKNPGLPDRHHLHSLVHRRLVRKLFPDVGSLWQNSLTGAFMWAAALLPAAMALQWPTHTGLLVLSYLFCAFVYLSVYARLTQFHWCFVPNAATHWIASRRATMKD